MIELPASFPQRDYTPHGYLDNPWHSGVLNRSGVIRSVPPMGFGWWCRRMPWAYGDGARRQINYLSFHLPSFVIDGKPFDGEVLSRYRTKNVFSYDWTCSGVDGRLLWFLADEHTLACLVELRNTGAEPKKVTMHCTHLYGYPETRWWGCDGVTSRSRDGASVAKIWAYGDVFVMCSTLDATYRATISRDEWQTWTRDASQSMTSGGATSHTPDPAYSVLSSVIELPPGEERTYLLSLTRGVNEAWTLKAADDARARAMPRLAELLAEDQRFYSQAPVLEGDWPEDWKAGWIYDLETLRMCVRPPIGIYKHHWDGMQIFNPRAVLGESLIDAMCLSYADPHLAREVILGTFADAPMPNVPCSREDGSMNMIGMGGEECGTAPIWVLPFLTIKAIFDRDPDPQWITKLYPHLEAFVQWWIENRTDETGRFFCNNSWESGQDGSKRFLIEKGEEGSEAEFVQTVDVEAAMADAMRTLAYLAPHAGQPDRAVHWQSLADRATETTRSMFYDGWFRDWDARTGKPILLPDYMDVMMMLPVSLGIATVEQIEEVKPKFSYFFEHPEHWLEWPSFMFCFTEAGWNAGLRQDMADIVAATADRVYTRTNSPQARSAGDHPASMPEPFNTRIPGTSCEYWPVSDEKLPGSEAYGWGATLPTLILRNILGLREGKELAPVLPESLRIAGRTYTVRNVPFQGRRIDVVVTVGDDGEVLTSVKGH